MKYGTLLLLETSGNFQPSLYLLEKSGHQRICALLLNLVVESLASSPPVPSGPSLVSDPSPENTLTYSAA